MERKVDSTSYLQIVAVYNVHILISVRKLRPACMYYFTEAKILVSDGGDIVDYGIGLS